MDTPTPDPARRARQQDRMLGWSPKGWGDHIDIVLDVIDQVSDHRAGR